MLAALTRKIFKLNKGEGKKVLQFALLGAILQAGIAIGLTTADTLFLTQVGSDALPNIYLLTPLVFLIYIPLYSFLINRIGIDRVFDLTMMLLVFGGIALSILLSNADPELAKVLVYAAKLYSVLWYIALYSLFWNFVDGYFDILDAKRLFSLLAAGSALGAACGGALVSVLVDYIAVDQLFLVWSALGLLTLPIVLACRKKHTRLEVEDLDSQSHQTLVDQTKSLFFTFKNSGFAMILGSTLFFTMIVTLVCEYQYSAAFAKQYNEAELAKLFGNLTFGVHIINLFINLFIFNRLVLLIGVRNTAMIQPVCYAATFIFFLLDNSVLAGAVGFFAYHGLLTSIDYNNTNLLLNALPTESKKQLRTFIEGICEPMANAIAGGFLIFVVAYCSPAQISAFGLGLSIFCFVLVLALRGAYLTSMVANMKHGWLDFSQTFSSLVARIKPAEIASLKEHAKSNKEALAAIELLAVSNKALALQALLDFIEQTKEAKQAAPLLKQLLGSSDVKISKWLKKNLDRLDASIIEVLAGFGLVDSNKGLKLQKSKCPNKRAAAAIILKDTNEKLALETLDSLLHAGEAEKLAALRAIGNLGSDKYLCLLLPYAKSDNVKIQHQALVAIEALASTSSVQIVKELLAVFASLAFEERQICLNIFNKVSDSDCIAGLLKNSERLIPAERRKIESILLNIGLKSIPTSLAILRDHKHHFKARSLAARSIAKLAFPQLQAISQDLILAELKIAYQVIYFAQQISNSPAQNTGLKVLQRYYQDIKDDAIEFVLELLTLSGRLANFELIAAALRSTNQKERGNAIETIQEACSQNINELLLPLLTVQNSEAQVKIFLENKLAETLSLEEILEQASASNFALECASALQALWELSASQENLASFNEQLTMQLADKKAQQSLFLIDTIVGLRCRSSLDEKLEPTPVEKLATFLDLELFSSFPIEDLTHLAETSEFSHFAKSAQICKKGQKVETLFIVTSGAIAGDSAATLLGEQAAVSQKNWDSDLYSEGCSLIKVNVSYIQEIAKANVNIAKNLLTKRLQNHPTLQNYFEGGVLQ